MATVGATTSLLIALHVGKAAAAAFSPQSALTSRSLSFRRPNAGPRVPFRAFSVAGDSLPAPAAAPAPQSAGSSDVDALDIRVGRIVKAWKHPDADSLYVEEVDVGEDSGYRTICSGLVKFIPEEELQGKDVIVLANLKPRNMKGIKSNGMLLAASDALHENVELIVPPEGSVPGERVWFGNEGEGANQADPATPNQMQKKKIWEALQPKLKTGDDRVVYLDSQPMRTSAGFVTSRSLVGANVA